MFACIRGEYGDCQAGWLMQQHLPCVPGCRQHSRAMALVATVLARIVKGKAGTYASCTRKLYPEAKFATPGVGLRNQRLPRSAGLMLSTCMTTAVRHSVKAKHVTCADPSVLAAVLCHSTSLGGKAACISRAGLLQSWHVTFIC